MVHRVLILVARLHIVMMFAQRLPVARVPEELRVTTVRADVIHDRRFDVLALALALYAQRVREQEQLREPSPTGIVTTRSSGPDFLRVQADVIVTVFLSLGHQLGAAGMPAGMVREPWHPKYLLHLPAKHVPDLLGVPDLPVRHLHRLQ